MNRDYAAQPQEQDGPRLDIDLLPTTMTGTRPTVTLVYSPARDRQREAEYVASLGFWQRLLYRVLSHSKRG